VILRPAHTRSRLAALRVTALAVALVPPLLTGCARKGPPTGGPPDVEPPSLVAALPDSGAGHVARDTRLTLTFSEGMDPRPTGDAVSIAPRVDIRERKWSGRRLTIVFAETLQAGQTYTVFLGSGARDSHGNPLIGRTTVVFSTGDSLPAGLLEGQVVAKGFTAGGTYLWCYDAAAGRSPDSTARDFDAVGLADRDGYFRVVGLPVPGRYRLWVFADLNNNRSFEPGSDILTPVDTVFTLAKDTPVASGFVVTVVNPRSPGKVRGLVLDSLHIERGVLAVMATSAADSTRRVMGTVDREGKFEISLTAGTWTVRAWRDLDRNREWQRDSEPASQPYRAEVQAAADIVDVTLTLVPAPAPAAGPAPKPAPKSGDRENR
jgi:hypothetical protein